MTTTRTCQHPHVERLYVGKGFCRACNQPYPCPDADLEADAAQKQEAGR
ncbi:MAG: hypothetical protein ACF8PN_08045 [Phycisphaerales bacterium]